MIVRKNGSSPRKPAAVLPNRPTAGPARSVQGCVRSGPVRHCAPMLKDRHFSAYFRPELSPPANGGMHPSGAIPTRTTPTTRFPARPTAARGGVRPDQDDQRNSLPPFADDPTRMSCRRTSGKPGTTTAEPRMLRRSSAKRYADNPPHRPSRPAKTTPESTLKPIRMRFSATRGAILTVLPEKPRSAVPAKANRAPIR